MAVVENIPREEWLKEMQVKSPSDLAFDAYVQVEQFIVDQTPLITTYRRNLNGDSKYATFCGSAMTHCSVVQIYNGQCRLNWKWRKKIPGITESQHAAINEAFRRFCASLEGSSDKGWEQIKVLRLGVERVNAALGQVSQELIEIMQRPNPIA